ncbi:ABC transporter substrate-binding protein [Caldilinea sp.]|jgi:multiple sugar transport system substrate-binding protein|uniref:ABC transporter substrate-binding protein n=1 Tax=Caldilinea sp. TaxID=2293560 RepID=UPI0021DD7F5C|nr:sugar ABC transporter substrate-binding protein [Caldilinea sp.]GIV67217.1 MAG: ABC transporter substrate-binding protein [Caldilinea sp.]
MQTSRFHRIGAWVSLLLIFAVVLAACGPQAAPSAAPAQQPAAPAAAPAMEGEWTLAKAAEPYKGVSINCVFLDRPGYRAAIELLPEFEQITGIDVNWEIMPYENSREKQVLDFTGMTGNYDCILIDVVWIGEFAASGWVVPLERFYNDPALADPELNLAGFFPILLESFGTWDNVIYGLPFDNYSGVLFYNRCMLEEAGFDGPPQTWMELKDVYGPALTKDGKYAFALQSRRGETQSADSFMRMIWPFGGSLLDENFEPNLTSEGSLAGLRFRQDLMKYMPPDIVEWDHDETVQGLAQGNVAMITEWSAFNAYFTDPQTSRIVDCIDYAVEPAGPVGPRPALGGFSLGVSANSSPEKQAATWLFIQWITSEAKAKDYIRAGGVSGRMSAYEDPELQAQYPYFEPLVISWKEYGNPVFRPRFPEWPAISELIAQTGTEMMLGSISVEDGAKLLNDQIRQILDQAGYYSGQKPKLQ